MLQNLVDRRALSFRVEVEPSLVGFPVEAVISVQVRPQAVNALAAHLARDPNTRCLFGTSGASQLFWHVLCRDSPQLWDVVTRRLGELEGVLNSDVAVVMRAHKRCGIVRAGRCWAPRAEGAARGRDEADVRSARPAGVLRGKRHRTIHER